MKPYLQKLKRAGRVAQGVGPEFKSQYCKKKTNKKTQSHLKKKKRKTSSLPLPV
jgi:hypothetical protein